MSQRTPQEIEAWERSQRRSDLDDKLDDLVKALSKKPEDVDLVDLLYVGVKRLRPQMPEATVWKLVATIVAAIARDRGVDLS